MTLWTRAFIGALLGAILTLVAHPASRPSLTAPFLDSGKPIENRRFALPDSFPRTLPDPVDDVSASLWIHVGAELSQRGELSTDQSEGLVRLAQIRGRKDADNAFWKIAEAMFLSKLNRHPDSVAAWRLAAGCLRYDDYQTRYLARLRESLAKSYSSGSWQFAYCHRLRSLAFAEMAEAFARALVAKASLKTPEDLNLRFDTLVIGNVFRDGSRNLAVMGHATQIVEVSSHPREMFNETRPKRLLMAHLDFKESLHAAGFEDKARRVEEVYNENDAWMAMTRRQDPNEHLKNLTFLGAILPTLPGVLLESAIAALALGLAGWGLERLSERNFRLASVAATILAVGLPIAVVSLTGSWLAMLATGLCSAFLLLGPRTTRAQSPRYLGPLFNFMAFVVALAFVMSASLFFLARTMPVRASISHFEPLLAGILDPQALAGLTLIVIACLFLFSPLWALAQHLRTLTVLARAIRTSAAYAGIAAMTLAIAATPVCVRLEAENQETLRQLMENEPVYYLLNRPS